MNSPSKLHSCRDAKLLATVEIDVDAINVSQRLRPVNELAVTSLIVSIEQQGLLAEIHVRKVRHRENRLFLIAGGHRIEAFRRMKRQKIPCKVWDCTDDWATVAEIDDNLAHNKLEPLDLAIFLRQRKEVYERMHPEAKASAFKGNRHTGSLATDNLAVASFAASTAHQMNKSERTVYRMISAAVRLTDAQIIQLRCAPNMISGDDLQTIAKLTSSADQDAVCIALSEGTAKSATEAMSQRNAKPGDAIRSDADKKYMALADAFVRAPMAAKRRFAKEYGDELRNLMDPAPVGPVVLPAPSFSSKKLPE
jgi:ParB family chromosome partitioning protein